MALPGAAICQPARRTSPRLERPPRPVSHNQQDQATNTRGPGRLYHARLESLESDLLKITGLVSVELDLDSLIDNIPYIIILAGYEIDARRPDYFQARATVRRAIIETCAAHDLYLTGDPIEDYGEHFYIVRRQGDTWKPLPPCKCGGDATLRYIKEFGQWAIECSQNGHVHNTGFCNTPQEAVKKWEELNV